MNKLTPKEAKEYYQMLEATIIWCEQEADRILLEIEKTAPDSEKSQLLDGQLIHVLSKLRREAKSVAIFYAYLIDNET